jgi:phosphatidylserine/phosphatidylglycerophosphate/cardiolipin synthase-like enzyme
MEQAQQKYRLFFKSTIVAIILAITTCTLPQHAACGTRLAAQPQATFELFFSPSRQAEEAIISFIAEARVSVHVAAYAFTSQPIAQALVEARARGLDVRVVLDKNQSASRHSVAAFLPQHGVPVRINGAYLLQHQKVVIVDAISVQTGSYNYTANARDRNSENLLIIRNLPELAEQYEVNWAKMWDEAKDLIRETGCP